MNLSDLQQKEVVSMKDGKKLGQIIDAIVDEKDGIITYFIAEHHRFFKRLFKGSEPVKFDFSNIEKIGEDVILVKLWYNLTTRFYYE